jgi:hypothetical protein
MKATTPSDRAPVTARTEEPTTVRLPRAHLREVVIAGSRRATRLRRRERILARRTG